MNFIAYIINKTLNSRGPKVEPYGINGSMGKDEEDFLKMGEIRDIDVKELWNQLM
jgi:hypothetical protein